VVRSRIGKRRKKACSSEGLPKLFFQQGESGLIERYTLRDEPEKTMVVFRTEKAPAKLLFESENFDSIELLKDQYIVLQGVKTVLKSEQEGATSRSASEFRLIDPWLTCGVKAGLTKASFLPH